MDETLVKREENFEINFKYEVSEEREHENLNVSESSDIKIEIVDWQKITEEENVTGNNSESTESLSRPPPTKLSRVTPTLCSICNTGFPNRQLCEDHVDKHHRDELRHRCRFCKKRFKDKSNTKKHEKIHDISRFSGPGSFECDICGKLYHLKGSLRHHMNNTHLGKIVKRSLTPSNVVRRLHSETGVKNPNRRKNSEEECRCLKCGRSFPYISALKEHMTQHTDERPFSCRHCGKSYKFQSSMKYHVQKAHEQGLPVRKYRRKMEPISCTICGKSFNVPSHLETHMYLHTGGDLPHKCTLCDKKYRFANELRHHIAASHKSPDASGLRTYECRICGKTGFRTPPEITRHIVKIHGYKLEGNQDSVKPFACGICGKPFYLGIGAVICAVLCHDPASLQKKMFRYKCPYCPDHFGFHCLSMFRKHVESEHPHEPVPRNVKNNHYYKDSFKKLPSVSWDRKRHEELRWGTGVPQEVVQSPVPLYIKFEKRPELHCSNKPLKLYKPDIEDEAVPRRKIKRKRNTDIDHVGQVAVSNDRGSKTVICKMCGESFISSRKFSNHKNACTNKFKIKSPISLPKSFPHRLQETQDPHSFTLASPEPRLRRNRVTHEIERLFKLFKPDMTRVLVSDSAAVTRILNFQSVSVCLKRLKCGEDEEDKSR